MFIVMLETRRGSEDGFVVRNYRMGARYEVTDTLGLQFIRAKWAKECPPTITCFSSCLPDGCEQQDE